MTDTSFFGAYDLRGVYPDVVGVDEAHRVGRAYGSFVDGPVLVGRDGRTHAEEVTQAFVDGVTSTGTDVRDAGMVPTPVVYYGSHRDDLYGAVVTASHNPPEYTGFKFTRDDGVSMSREGGMERVQEIYESGEFEEGSGGVEEVDLVDDYVEFVADKVNLENELSVAANFGNGVAAEVGVPLLERIGCDVHAVNAEVDGTFPNHPPNPQDEDARSTTLEAVQELDVDLGLIFDGDGDRAGFVLADGIVDEDTAIAVLARHSLEHWKGDVLYDLRASQAVPEVVERYGGNPVETRVGHTYISEGIMERDAAFAGEISGHYYFPALDAPWDDGLLAAAVFSELAASGNLRERLDEVPVYPVSPELRIPCPEERKQAVVEAVADCYSEFDVSTVDGVKVEFPDGAALVRPSNTEEKISVRCEGETADAMERILDDVESTVRDAIESG